MGFGQAIKSGFSNLTNFKGRSRRSEFWWFYLLMVIISIPLTFIISIPLIAAFASLGSSIDENTSSLTDAQTKTLVTGIVITYGLAILLGIIVFLLMVALWVRRLHDAGYSGHWLWFTLVGLGIVPLILAILEGNSYPNKWGPDPKAITPDTWPQASPTLTPPPYVPPAAAVPQQVPPPVTPDDPASDPFAGPPR